MRTERRAYIVVSEQFVEFSAPVWRSVVVEFRFLRFDPEGEVALGLLEVLFHMSACSLSDGGVLFVSEDLPLSYGMWYIPISLMQSVELDPRTSTWVRAISVREGG